MITFVYKGHGLKLGYDDMHNFCVFDEAGEYSNLFNLAITSRCLMKMTVTLVEMSFNPTNRIIPRALTDAQMKWLSKYIEVVKETERENDRLGT